MARKSFLYGIIGFMLLFAVFEADAETITATFVCIDDDADFNGSINLRSNGSCRMQDPSSGETISGTYDIDGPFERGGGGSLAITLEGQTYYYTWSWPFNGNPRIWIDGWTFERR
jgi:hypothetical protein